MEAALNRGCLFLINGQVHYTTLAEGRESNANLDVVEKRTAIIAPNNK